MLASEIMTKTVVAVTPETPAREVARMLLDHAISAVPVVDAAGAVVGMVSEGDLVGRDDAQRQARRDWWIALLAEGEELNPDFLASLCEHGRTARDVMSTPVVTVGETITAREIARLLAAHHIKRVPVVRDGRIVGIVSRADLLQAFADEPAPGAAPKPHSEVLGLIEGAIAKLDDRFIHREHEAQADRSAPAAPAPEPSIAATDFAGLVADYERRKTERRDEARRASDEQRRETVKTLIDHHVADQGWKSLLHGAREAAENGATEFMLLRFPSELCSDGGRAINAPLPDWPGTLRGEAAELYLRWERELRPCGFRLTARVLNFPGGMPGDVGLFLAWDK